MVSYCQHTLFNSACNSHTYHCDGSLYVKAPDSIGAVNTIRRYDCTEVILEATITHCPLDGSNEPAHHPHNVKHKILEEDGRVEGVGGRKGEGGGKGGGEEGEEEGGEEEGERPGEGRKGGKSRGRGGSYLIPQRKKQPCFYM